MHILSIFKMACFYHLMFWISLSATNILNFAPVNNIPEAVVVGDNLYLATSGGLVLWQISTGQYVTTEHSADQFPDIFLTAISYDDTRENLWMGSKDGYLYRRTSRGEQQVFYDFVATGAEIQVLYPYGDYLLVGHSQGLTVFDTKQGTSLVTKSKWFTGESFSAYSLVRKDDTLFAGVGFGDNKGGIMRLDSLSTYIANPRFGDNSPLGESFWKPWESATITLQSEKGAIFSLIYRDSLEYYYGATVYQGNKRIEATGKVIRRITENGGVSDSVVLGSDVNSLLLLPDGRLVATTSEDYFFLDPLGVFLEEAKQSIPGLANQSGFMRVFVASDQSLWTLPRVVGARYSDWPWWNAVERMQQEGQVDHFNGNTLGFGNLGGCDIFVAITEMSDGTLFLGNCSDHLKMRTPEGQWSRWILNNMKFQDVYPDSVVNDVVYPWMKIDGLFADQSDILWGTYWWEPNPNQLLPSKRPTFFAFRPKTKEFRYFEILEESERALVPRHFVQMSSGDICLGFHGSRDIWLIDRSKDPFDTTSSSQNDYVLEKKTVSNPLYSMEKTGGGNVLVGTGGLPQIYNANSQDSGSAIRSIKDLPADFDATTYSIVLERSMELLSDNINQRKIQSVYWIANNKVGLERIAINEYLSDDGFFLDSAVYDPTVASIRVSRETGGVNQEIYDVAIDSVHGYIWAVGDRGVSRILLPYETTKVSTNDDVLLFPNPYSHTRHSEIQFTRCAPNSFIDIYTVSGKLIQHLDRASMHFSDNSSTGWSYRWTPDKNIAPGTYIVAVKGTFGQKVDREATQLRKLVILP